MSEPRDAQDVAESLDPDALRDYEDPEGNVQYPPDKPMGVDQYGTTAAEERVDELLEERVGREIADPLDDIDEPDVDTMREIEAEAIDPYPAIDGRLAAQLGEPPLSPDSRSTLDDDRLDENRPRVGRLLAPGGDDPLLHDNESDAIARDVDDTTDLSAEEAAIHLVVETSPSLEDD